MKFQYFGLGGRRQKQKNKFLQAKIFLFYQEKFLLAKKTGSSIEQMKREAEKGCEEDKVEGKEEHFQVGGECCLEPEGSGQQEDFSRGREEGCCHGKKRKRTTIVESGDEEKESRKGGEEGTVQVVTTSLCEKDQGRRSQNLWVLHSRSTSPTRNRQPSTLQAEENHLMNTKSSPSKSSSTSKPRKRYAVAVRKTPGIYHDVRKFEASTKACTRRLHPEKDVCDLLVRCFKMANFHVRKEFKCYFGKVDIVVFRPTKQIIEVKHATQWKHAIGQIMAYGSSKKLENFARVIYLFGEEDFRHRWQYRIHMEEVCRKTQIELRWWKGSEKEIKDLLRNKDVQRE